MGIIIRTTEDMFEMDSVCSYLTNPVNIMGVPGAGLALEFRRRVPGYVEPYKAACLSKDLRIGTVQVIEDTGHSWGIINFPTKRHWQDVSQVDDIVRGLEALKELLSQDRYRYSVVVLPMLGAGLGRLDYPTIFPLMVDHLSDLEATVFISMSPKRTEMRPRYLSVAGPLDYGLTKSEQDTIDWTITKTLKSWGTSLQSGDYEGVVSGGYPGVDSYVCGSTYGQTSPKNPDGIGYQDSYVWKQTEKMPLVVRPNPVREGVGANILAGNLLCEIGDDIILFKPKGHNNNRLSAMQHWLKTEAPIREEQGRPPRRVAIFGDTSPEPVAIDMLQV